MRALAIGMISAVALAGCSAGGGTGEYDMSAEEARSKLLAANFERGILPGSSRLKPRVQTDSEGSLEWQVLDDSEKGNGWWCPVAIEPSGEDGKKVRVVNQCKGITASKKNSKLDELVDATLTGRPVKFD